ncbi:MAG: ribosome maturation factor RimM [Pseudomonadales bacterium]|jgi:16S rRNA processing protein RimM|nr:ribosome maturation factor RimM [Pseudomonadales bacterium]MDP7597406.1 ribosome maturation factor RimM [Pseudomonadales bacterium]HJN53103.1 ribosome maturation factor RimM [Pseudomonadales bacterium]|tara:strand:- start:153 stop:683 length:531 start_codon:yes stop_codon:yes gene_type:complete
MEADCSDTVILGRVLSVYGVKGWLRIYSYTDPIETILSYRPWLLRMQNSWQEMPVAQGRKLTKAIIARLDGCESRDQATNYCGAEIAISSSQLTELKQGEYYWRQLEGLVVVDTQGNRLGKVDHLIETGANDVLVVQGDSCSIDNRERLIPFTKGRAIRDVDLAEAVIRVDWDSDF